MVRIGATTLPLAGWVADPARPDESRVQRLAAIRRLIQTYHLSAVELTADLGAIYPHVFGAPFYAAVSDLQQELGFTCTVHLPFLWVDLCSLNEPIRQASVDWMRRVVAWARPVQAEAFVLHLWGFTTTQIAAALHEPAPRQAILNALMAQARRSLDEVCDSIDPRLLCIENLEDSLFDVALPVVEQQGASICLDVGHLAWHGGDAFGFWERHRPRIREVHLHDVQGNGWPVRDHLALGRGQLDYAGLLQRLEDADFSGVVILEVNTQADLEQSLEAVSAYL